MIHMPTDVRVWEDLWREHADRLLLYATTLLSDRSAAEDAVQNVFVRLIAAGEPPVFESEGAYLFRAVRNEALNAIRSRRPVAHGKRPLFDDEPEKRALLAEFGQRVEVALLRLDPEHREAVVLKLWGDLSFPEAAELLGVTPKTLEHRYYRGLAALKELLGERHE